MKYQDNRHSIVLISNNTHTHRQCQTTIDEGFLRQAGSQQQAMAKSRHQQRGSDLMEWNFVLWSIVQQPGTDDDDIFRLHIRLQRSTNDDHNRDDDNNAIKLHLLSKDGT